MGGQRHAPSLLEKAPYLQALVVTENDFVRRHRLQSHDSTIQVLAYPVWKICSDYQDCIMPIQENVLRFVELQSNLALFTMTLQISNCEQPSFQLMLSDTAKCVRIHLIYLMKLRSLMTRTKNLFNVLFDRKEAMVEWYRVRNQHLNESEQAFVCNIFGHKICYVMQMCMIIRERLSDSIRTGTTVLECSKLNLLQATRFYYRRGIPFPESPPVLRNIMGDLLGIVIRESEDHEYDEFEK